MMSVLLVKWSATEVTTYLDWRLEYLYVSYLRRRPYGCPQISGAILKTLTRGDDVPHWLLPLALEWWHFLPFAVSYILSIWNLWVAFIHTIRIQSINKIGRTALDTIYHFQRPPPRVRECYQRRNLLSISQTVEIDLLSQWSITTTNSILTRQPECDLIIAKLFLL